jgi:hypothetical protein
LDIQIRIDEGKGFRFQTVTGEVSFEELRRALASIYGGAETLGMDSLWDLSEAEMSISSEEVGLLSDFVGGHWEGKGGARSALVVPEDLAFGLARMYGARLSPSLHSQIGVFRELEEALNWLGLDVQDGGG